MLSKVTCFRCRAIFKVKDPHPPLAEGEDATLSAPVVSREYSQRECPVCRPDSPWRLVKVKCEHCGRTGKVQLGSLFSQRRFKGDVPTR